MEDCVRDSDFVLCICTPQYAERFDGQQEPGTGLGVQWEGRILRNLLQSDVRQLNKVQVIQFDYSDTECIPLTIRDNNRFAISNFALSDDSFLGLYRVVTSQPQAVRPVRGDIIKLQSRRDGSTLDTILPPRQPRPEAPRSGASAEKLSLRMDVGTAKTRDVPANIRRRPSIRPGAGNFISRLITGYLNDGYKAYTEDRLVDATAFISKVLNLDRGNRSAHNIAAMVAYKRRDWGECSRCFKLVMQGTDYLDGQDRVRFAIANIWNENIDDEEGARILASLLKDYPRDNNVTLLVSGYFTGRQEYALARQAVLQREGYENEGYLCGQLAIIAWMERDIEAATKWAQKAVDLDPGATDLWANLGVARAESGRFGLAIEALRRSIHLSGQALFAKFALAEVYALMGDADAAVEQLSQLVKLGYHELHRVFTERTFNPIRDTIVFQSFVRSIESTPTTRSADA